MASFGLLMMLNMSGSAAEVAFSTPFYSVNLNGDMTTLGNTIIWKDTAAANAYGVDANTSLPTDRNNAYTMKFVDVLSDGAVTFNSSSSSLNIPTGYTVKWAGLYWQGHIVNTALEAAADNSKIGTGANANAIYNDAKSKANTVYFKLPSGLDYNLTAQVYYDYPTDLQGQTDRRYLYSGFYDVTNYVKAAGNGSYTVGNLRTSEGQINTWGGLGGWAMLVVYEDPSGALQLKNISLFHGYRVLNSGQSQDINVSGFYTPTAGTINASLAVFVADGDKLGTNSTNERLKMWNTSSVLTDINNSTNPLLNVFNSSITNFGVDNVTRTPYFSDNLGIDIDRFDVSSYMSYGQSSTKIQVSTAGDLFTLDLIAFATDVYQPNICYVENIFKGTTNISGVGAQVNLDDNLTVRVYLKNTGNERASKVQVQHQFDNLFPYVAHSANYNNSNPTYQTVMPPPYTRTAATDSSGNDLYEYNTTSLLGKINLGINANSTEGGDFNSSSSSFPTYAVFEYNATVKAVDSNYSNIYKASYVNVALGIDYSANPIILSSCDGSINSFYGYSPPAPVTSADIIDTFTTIASYNNGTQKYIGTKISDKSNVTITAVHLDSGGQAAAYAPSNSSWKFSVIPFWSDGTCTATENVLNAANEQVVIDISSSSVSATSAIKVKPKAHTNSRFKVIVVDPATLSVAGQQCIANSSTTGNFARVAQCANSEVQYRAAFGDNAWNRCGLGGGLPCVSSNHGVADPSEPSYNPLYHNELGCYMCTFDITPTCSTDNFAIRPDRLDVNSSHIHMPSLLRSAQDYNTTIHAYDFNGTMHTVDYNVTNVNTSFSMVTKMYDRNNIERNSTTVPAMYGTSSFAASDFNISNGISVKAGIIGNEVAGLSFNDVGKINISIKDQQWSAVDINNAIDPTVHDCSANGAYICGDKNVTFIPEHFDFSELNITNNNGNPGSFTYIANEVDKMAGRIQTKIRALNKNSAVTHNFNQTPLWENPITVVPVISKSTYLYPDANETNITNIAVGFGIGTDANGTKTIGWDETNSSKYLRFNFRRDVNQTANAFNVVGTDLNISIVSTYIDGAKQADINGSRLGTGVNDLPYVDVTPADGNSTFVYGRIIPRDIRIFGSVPFSANGWYEIYNSPTLNATSMPASKNEPMWYTNTLHTDFTDGNGTVSQMSSGNLPNNTTYAAGVKTYNFNASATIPYSAKAHINTDPWLWYGVSVSSYLDPSAVNLDCRTHPCFNINVVPAVGATGSAKSTNEATKDSKASTSGGGAWRSTSDYAPAVR